MLFRKIQKRIENHLQSENGKILLIDGARQVGKTYIIRDTGQRLFKNYIEVNLLEDSEHDMRFANARTVSDFYLQLSTIAGKKMGDRKDTLVFLDEIQAYPHLLTLLKFLKEDDKFNYIASGSELGIALSKTSSIPMGSISVLRMHQLDFEEFLYANGYNRLAIGSMRESYENRKTLDETMHNNVMDLFRKYLLVGGMPEAVNDFMENHNIVTVREIQHLIHDFYASDASKYDAANRLKIRRIYEMIPSMLENKKKRIRIKDIEGIKGKTYSDYADEFDYLISAGIALDVKAVSTPVFPLIENSTKNLIKLYLNDTGILTAILYENNINAVLNDVPSINLGTVYESVSAQELISHGHKLYYYDNRKKGEVDFLINDYDTLSVKPIEIKSGKDYYIHRALDAFLANDDYPVKQGIVLSNERDVRIEDDILYLPIYYLMFL